MSTKEKETQKVWANVKREFKRYGLKPSSVKAYTNGLKRFCEYVSKNELWKGKKNFNPKDFKDAGLDNIQDWIQDFIADNRDELAPKYLNLIFNSVKRYAFIKKMVESTKFFREIKFDKSSRKSSALMETPLETKHIKTAFKIADLDEQIDLGLYGLVALRPRLIPQLRVKNLYPKNYKIENGKFKFTIKPPIAIIPKEFAGNKGNVDFLVFIPTKLAELIEIKLNSNGTVTPETKISESENARAVYWKMKQILTHEAINFNGRPYLLRSYGDGILERITRQFNDEDFKESLMGHKGKISAIYQMRALTSESESEYRKMYVEACDKFINERIFEMVSKEDKDKGSIISEMAKKLGVDDEKLKAIEALFHAGKMTLAQFDDKITKMIKDAQNQQLESKFEQMFKKMNDKYNNGA